MSTTSHKGLLALSSSLLALSTIFIGVRFYSRRLQKAPLKMDDWIMLPCLLGIVGTTATAFYGVNKKILGYPTPADSTLVVETAAMASKLYFVFDLFNVLTLGCIKISALFFYHRIFTVSGRRNLFQILIIGSIVVCCIWIVGYSIFVGLSCGTHFSALWTTQKAIFLRYCKSNPHKFLLSLAISDFILDFWIICLPIPQVFRIKTSLTRRFAIVGVFLLAFVGFGACVARLAVFVELNNVPTTKKVDSRLENTKSIYLSILEIGLSCIAVNLPSIYYLTHKITPENVLRSVRSIISLRSIGSNNSRKGSPYTNSKASKEQSASLSNLRPDDTMAIEAHAMHDLESTGHLPEPNNVHVTKTVRQTSQQV